MTRFVSFSKYALPTIGTTLVFCAIGCVVLTYFLHVFSGWGKSFNEWLVFCLQVTGVLTICVAFVMGGGQPMQARMRPPREIHNHPWLRIPYYVPGGKERFSVFDDILVTVLMVGCGVLIIGVSFVL